MIVSDRKKISKQSSPEKSLSKSKHKNISFQQILPVSCKHDDDRSLKLQQQFEAFQQQNLIYQLKSTINNLCIKIESLNLKLDQEKSSNQKLKKQNSSLQIQFKKLTNGYRDINKQIDLINKQILDQDILEQHKDNQQKSSIKIFNLKEKLKSYKLEIQNLQSLLKESQQQQLILLQKLRSHDQQKLYMSKSIHNKKDNQMALLLIRNDQQTVNLTQQIQFLKTIIDQNVRQIKFLKQTNQQREEKLNYYRKQLENKSQGVNWKWEKGDQLFKDTMLKKQSKIDELLTENNKQANNIMSLEQKLLLKDHNLQQQRELNSQLKQRINLCQKRYKQLQDTYFKQERQLSTLVIDKDQIYTKLQTKNKSLELQIDMIKDLHAQELEVKMSTIKKLQNKNTLLQYTSSQEVNKRKIDIIQKEMKILQEENNILKKEKQKLQQKILEIMQNFKIQEDKLKNQKKILDEQIKKHLNLYVNKSHQENKKKQKKQQYQKLYKNINKLQKQHQQLLIEINNKNNRLKQKQIQFNQIQQKNKQLLEKIKLLQIYNTQLINKSSKIQNLYIKQYYKDDNPQIQHSIQATNKKQKINNQLFATKKKILKHSRSWNLDDGIENIYGKNGEKLINSQQYKQKQYQQKQTIKKILRKTQPTFLNNLELNQSIFQDKQTQRDKYDKYSSTRTNKKNNFITTSQKNIYLNQLLEKVSNKVYNYPKVNIINVENKKENQNLLKNQFQEISSRKSGVPGQSTYSLMLDQEQFNKQQYSYRYNDSKNGLECSDYQTIKNLLIPVSMESQKQEPNFKKLSPVYQEIPQLQMKPKSPSKYTNYTITTAVSPFNIQKDRQWTPDQQKNLNYKGYTARQKLDKQYLTKSKKITKYETSRQKQYKNIQDQQLKKPPRLQSTSKNKSYQILNQKKIIYIPQRYNTQPYRQNCQEQQSIDQKLQKIKLKNKQLKNQTFSINNKNPQDQNIYNNNIKKFDYSISCQINQDYSRNINDKYPKTCKNNRKVIQRSKNNQLKTFKRIDDWVHQRKMYINRASQL